MNVRQTETKWIDIDSSYEQVFSFLSQPKNWLKFAMKSLKPRGDGSSGWHYAESRWGVGELRIETNELDGVIEQKWKGLKSSWTVPMRLLENGRGTTLVMTLPRYKDMSDGDFEQSLLSWEHDLKSLKKQLEL